MSLTQKGRYLHYLKLIGFYFAGVISIFALIYFAGETIEFMPDNALLLIDMASNTYYSPPLLESDERNFLFVTALGYARDNKIKVAREDLASLVESLPNDKVIFLDMKNSIFYLLPQDGYTSLYPDKYSSIKEKGYSPDERHRDLDGFTDNYRGVIEIFMDLIGKRNGRWTEAGGWRW